MSRGLIKILESQAQESDTSNTTVGDQIERNYRFYSLQPIGNEIPGRSHYISPDVMDSVESKKALFRETFLSNRQTVKFSCDASAPTGEADAKTAYVNTVLDDNDKARLFSDCWMDAFIAKRCVVLPEWVQDFVPTTMSIDQPVDEQTLYQIISQQEDVAHVDTSQMEMIQQMAIVGPNQVGPVTLLQGPVTIYKDESRINLTLCKPERYYRDPMVADVADSMWAGVMEDVPRGTLKELGYDPDQVDELKNDYRWRTDEIDYARKAHDQSHSTQKQVSRSDDTETVTLYKTWTWANLADETFDDGTEFPDEFKLWEVHWAGGEVLRWSEGGLAIREAEEIPFVEWSEYRIPHAEHGMADADVVAHSQKTNSVLKRLIIDNQQMRNTTRYEAVQQNLLNPRDLLDNQIGGVVWSEQIGSVAPLPTPELSPLTMGVLQMMNADVEKRSGVSELGKGLNTDVVKYQNAADMVERLTNAGTRRPAQAARDWAESFLIPLCARICKLGMENDSRSRRVEVSGQIVMVNPQQWTDYNLSMEVAVALTPQEATEHAQRLMMMHQMMSNDPQLNAVYGLQQRHALFDDMFDALGVSDTSKYMMRPDSPEFAQMMQQQQQQAMQQQQMQMEQMQFQRGLIEADSIRKDQELRNKIMDTTHDNELDDEKFEWDKVTDIAEMEIERQQQRPVNVG